MKRFLETGEASTSKKLKSEGSSEFIADLQKSRSAAGDGIINFKFNKKRVKILSKVYNLHFLSN